MFCNKCGANNSEGANFCQKCGYHFTNEEETRIATHRRNIESGTEQRIFSIRPTLLFVKLGYGLAIVSAFLLVFILYYLAPNLPWWCSIVFGIGLLTIPAYYHLRQKAILYTLTDAKIEIDHGFIFQNSRNIPLRSIQDVAVSSSIIQRMLGFGDVVIDNASETGGKVVLKNIDTPKKYADDLLQELRLLHK